MAKFCSNCGKELKEGAKFCSECGSAVLSPDSSVQDIGINIEQLEPDKSILEKNSAKNTTINTQTPKKKGCGCGLVFVVIILAIIVGILVSTSGPKGKVSQVDELFIENMNTTLGGNFAYGMSDHRSYYEDSLQEYIGNGSLSDGNVSYEYSYRAFIKDNTAIFVKVSVYDIFGNAVIDYYDLDAETEYLDSIDKKE